MKLMEYLDLLQKKTALSNGLFNVPAQTFYESKINKLTGSYTVAWSDKGEEHSHKASLRITDFEGHRINPSSFKYLLPAITTYLQAKKSYIIERPVPFIVYEAINFMNDILKPGTKVLEFGSGNSTLWFLEKKCDVTSIEHDTLWYKTVNDYAQSASFNKQVMEQFSFKNTQKEATWALLDKTENESFDLILVDGSNDFNNRNECIEKSISKLKKGGWMVLDNSDHPNNWPGGLYMDSLYKRVRFTGFTPMGLYISQTSFWQKTD
jgi:16S rRNA G966 N2-methylase RsmD